MWSTLPQPPPLSKSPHIERCVYLCPPPRLHLVQERISTACLPACTNMGLAPSPTSSHVAIRSLESFPSIPMYRAHWAWHGQHTPKQSGVVSEIGMILMNCPTYRLAPSPCMLKCCKRTSGRNALNSINCRRIASTVPARVTSRASAAASGALGQPLGWERRRSPVFQTGSSTMRSNREGHPYAIHHTRPAVARPWIHNASALYRLAPTAARTSVSTARTDKLYMIEAIT